MAFPAMPAGPIAPIYNGYAFNSSTRTVLNGKPLYDQADRTIIAIQYTLDVSTIIHNNGANMQALMAAIEQRLTVAGQALQYANNGSAGYLINLGSRDCMWGPKPRIIIMRPVGGALAWELVWKVEFAVPRCSGASFVNAIMAFNYTVDYQIDQDRYTTRIIAGYLEIPMTRVAGGALVPDSADAYYEDVVPDVPPGFQRVAMPRTLSMDKRKLEFRFEDKQIVGGAMPKSVTSYKGNHHISTEPGNWIKFTNTLSASYVVPAGVDKGVAWDAFVALLQSRLPGGAGRGGINLVGGAVGGRIFLGFEADEGLGSNREVSFSASWWMTSTVAKCMADNGFFSPLPNTWNEWAASSGIGNVRGSAGLFFNAADDAIIDLCTHASTTTIRGGAITGGFNQLTGNGIGAIGGQIPADQSWIYYRAKITVQMVSSSARLKRLPVNPPTSSGMGEVPATGQGGAVFAVGNNFNALATTSLSTAIGSGAIVADQTAPPDVIQNRGTPSYRVLLTGEAARIAYKIPLPKLVLVGGVVPIPGYQQADADTPIMNLAGVPVYYKSFTLSYDLPQAPDNAKIEVPGNPVIQIDK